ncbi:hypothetical protein [Paludisphaera soli]|uniref:hypothetical protein n=1 Tax=Paludisphaera soli TaxID=2712865 RepID=UPI0013EDD7C2|nr:hypothetical protein [Paludisphaera soli]
MSELGALKRASTALRRRGGVQRRLNMPAAEGVTLTVPTPPAEGPPEVRFRRPRKAAPALRPEPADRTPPPPVFHPLAYRSVVAAWTLEARERWGLRSNELEDAGLSWRDAETQAFVEVWNHLRRESGFADPDRS